MLHSYNNFVPSLHPTTFIAPGAIIIGQVSTGKSTSIWFQAVLRGDINQITIGNCTNIQDGCLLHVTKRNPLIVGDKVTVGHGAILHGCKIGNECLIAMGAIILDGAILEDECLIAAGSVVPPGTYLPAKSVVMGVPGKIVRQITTSDQEAIKSAWQNYLGYANSYAEQIPN